MSILHQIQPIRAKVLEGPLPLVYTKDLRNRTYWSGIIFVCGFFFQHSYDSVLKLERVLFYYERLKY